jgi:hypothetical protein
MREYSRAHDTAFGKIPYGVLFGKSLTAAAPRKCLPDAILELAKGFEPLTL